MDLGKKIEEPPNPVDVSIRAEIKIIGISGETVLISLISWYRLCQGA